MTNACHSMLDENNYCTFGIMFVCHQNIDCFIQIKSAERVIVYHRVMSVSSRGLIAQ